MGIKIFGSEFVKDLLYFVESATALYEFLYIYCLKSLDQIHRRILWTPQKQSI